MSMKRSGSGLDLDQRHSCRSVVLVLEAMGSLCQNLQTDNHDMFVDTVLITTVAIWPVYTYGKVSICSWIPIMADSVVSVISHVDPMLISVKIPTLSAIIHTFPYVYTAPRDLVLHRSQQDMEHRAT